jgi:hypothetical protein
MDTHLKLLADSSLTVAAAEEALAEGAHHAATEHLDTAVAALAELRAAWPAMTTAQRALVAVPAADVRARSDAVRARIPRLSALTLGSAESDPEEDEEPH